MVLKVYDPCFPKNSKTLDEWNQPTFK